MGSAGPLWSGRNVAIGAAFLAIVIGVGVGNLAAQSPTENDFPETPRANPLPRAFLAVWTDPMFGGEGAGGNCGSLIDEYGNPRGTCQFPVDQLEPLLNGRARAWIEFFDEPLSPRWACVAANITTLLGEPYLWEFSVRPDVVMQHFEQSNWVREIFVDGRPHPPAEQVFYQGHSIGRMEGSEFLVETTNFTFDPDGFDDQSHIATSHRKKLTERYAITGPDSMEVTITVEDPIFLTAPFTWTNAFSKADRDWTRVWACDPDVGLRHLYSTVPQRYPDDVNFDEFSN